MQLNLAPAEFSKYNLSVHEPTTQAASEPSTLEATVLQQWPDVLARSQPSATWSSRKFRESDEELIYAARLQAQQAGASLRMQLRAEHPFFTPCAASSQMPWGALSRRRLGRRSSM